jgi:hypothetical protein
VDRSRNITRGNRHVSAGSCKVLEEGFSVFAGGPLFRLYQRTGVSGAALEHGMTRSVAVALLAWLPLLVITSLEGNAWGGSHEPFILDIAVHLRLLIVLPMLVGGELLCHTGMRIAMGEFLERDMIAPAHLPRFEASLRSAQRWRDSTVAELVLVALVYGVGIAISWRATIPRDIDTWYHRLPGPIPAHVTVAGWWYVLISLPLFQFILYRWYFRMIIWVRLLAQVAGTGLRLIATHPDRCGGLGFIGEYTWAFRPLLVAHGILFAGVAATGIFFDARSLPDYIPLFGVLVVIALLVICGPLLVFVPTLVRTRRSGLRRYGDLAQSYVRDFECKWLNRAPPANEPLLGSADLQSLADLSNSVQIVQDMSFVPITRMTALALGLITLAPIAPLLLTLISVRQLAKLVLKSLT